jgi:transcriptional regulator with XRE-family HTH domain
MKPLKDRLAERIARQRRVVGLTQAELAERAEVQPETVSRIERGRHNPSLGLLILLAEALDLELHELLRLPASDTPKDRAVERLLWFASRLSAAEIELVMDVGTAVLPHTRKALSDGSHP